VLLDVVVYGRYFIRRIGLDSTILLQFSVPSSSNYE
jgi:hypothetical protein